MKTDYLKLLHEELVVALGCTEPVCVALAAALAREQALGAGDTENGSGSAGSPRALDGEPIRSDVPEDDFSGQSVIDPGLIESVEMICSVNIYKNAMGVFIPGTRDMGAGMAAALGVVAGNASRGLQVLEGMTDEQIEAARTLFSANKVTLKPAPAGTPTLYAEAVVRAGGHTGRAVIAWKHDLVAVLERDGRTAFRYDLAGKELTDSLTEEDLGEIWQFASSVDLSDLDIIREAIRLNEQTAEEGLRNSYGLEVGRAVFEKESIPALAGVRSQMSFADYCAARTAAAADARMAGITLPVMSNSGSGNQGLTVTVSVTSAAQYLNSSEEALLRAETLSHLVAIHIKRSFGRLSPLCGATAAAVGASAGMVMLLGGGLDRVTAAVQNMFGTVTGLICDGAKLGCALKVASCIYAAVQAALVAMRGNEIRSTDGVIECDVEKTIRNMERISKEGMPTMDDTLLNIMLNKEQVPAESGE